MDQCIYRESWSLDFKMQSNLQGDEFVTHFYNQTEPTFMILIKGDNMDGAKEGPSIIYMYMFIDGEVDHGIETFIFSNSKSAWDFINKLPQMSAIDFMIASIGCPPKIY